MSEKRLIYRKQSFKGRCTRVSLDLVGPLAEGRERWPGKNLAGSLPSSSGVDGDASLHLLCCAAARSYRHHDCQITVAIGHGRVTVNSQYFKGGETPASHRRTTYRGSTCLAGQVVMTPASSLHVQTAPRPLFHGGTLRILRVESDMSL